MKHLWLLAIACASGCATEAAEPTEGPAPVPTVVVSEQVHAIAGVAQYQLVQRPDETRCGGIVVIGTRGAGEVITPDLAPFASLIDLPYPTGLEFSGPQKAQSLATFEMWIEEMKKRGAAATDYYVQAHTAATDAAGRAIAGARLAQTTRWFADALAHAEVPIDVRTGEFSGDKTAAFCTQMTEVAKPLYARAEAAAHACAADAAQAGTGWWSAVCR